MQYDPLEFDQQELDEPNEMDVVTDKTPPVENQIIGYNEAQDKYVLKSAGEIQGAKPFPPPFPTFRFPNFFWGG